MHEEASIDARLRLHRRVGHGMRRPANWFQLGRFVAVGTSGFVVNLAVFAIAVHVVGLDYRLAAGAAFLVAVLNNFGWNRHWTFSASEGHAGFQAFRFFVVSGAAFGLNLALLQALVAGAGAPRVPAQAIAIVCATPVSFLGNKLWTFRP